MPNNIQARTDDMAPAKKNSHKVLTSIILFVVFAVIVGPIAFA